MDAAATHSNCGLPYELSNFQGMYKCDKQVAVGRPKSLKELSELVKHYDHVKAVGVGHSWWKEQFCPAGTSGSIGITLTELEETQPVFSLAGDKTRAIEVHEDKMTVSVAAGVPQRTLLTHLAKFKTAKAPEGYTLGSHCWFIDQTIGGVVATASHGSSLTHGSVSDQLVAVDLMVANGTTITITREGHPHLFRAVHCSVGRLGIITRLELRIITNTVLKRTKKDVSVEDWLDMLMKMQNGYNAARATGDQDLMTKSIAHWDNVQMFWHYADKDLWLVNYTRIDHPEKHGNMKITSFWGDKDEPLGPPGAYKQKFQPEVGAMMFVEQGGAKNWAPLFKGILSWNVRDGVFPSDESFIAMTEFQNKWLHGLANYDQYEVVIPITSVGDCLKEVTKEVYSRKLWEGTRPPALVRFTGVKGSGGLGYITPDVGVPHMFINMEDYLFHATKKENKEFQEIIRLFRTTPQCKARLHWGKAGWPQHASCFDGATEFPDTWCDFGCAVHELDPEGKFSSSSSVWRWNAKNKPFGLPVPLQHCCTAQGFDKEKCVCAKRTGCL